MKIIGNILWLIFGGLSSAFGFLILGIIFCITIIGIPIGLQCFKLAELVLTPFGKDIQTNFGKNPLMNILWMIFVGWYAMLYTGFIGIVLCITIIGIPFGLQWFKIAKLVFIPFAAEVK